MKKFTQRISADYRFVITELKILIKSLYTMSKVAVTRRAIRDANIEIGSILHREGFYTVDIDWRADFPYDLRIGLPFANDSIKFIYAEHVLEHFLYHEFMGILREIFRVLKVGGVLSIVVPDVRPILTAYTAPDDVFTGVLSYEYPDYLATKLDIINYLLYMDGAHKNSFDVDNITWALRNAGFSDVRIRDFDPTLDKEERRNNSLYVDCRKAVPESE
jgi:predicted SAM-dependent methyltransferase